MSTVEELETLIASAGQAVRDLKSSGADKSAVDAAVAKLLEFKASYKIANNGVDYGPPPVKKEKKPVPPQAPAREGPSKKELNKLKRKAGRSKGNDEDSVTNATSLTTPTETSTNQPKVVSTGELLLFVNSAHPADLTQLVSQLTKSTLKVEVTDESTVPMLVGGGSGSISGDSAIARYLVRSASSTQGSLYSENDIWISSQIDQWLQLYESATGSQGDVISLLRVLESHLADKTYIAGHALTLADMALALVARKKRGAIQPRVNIERWFALVSPLVPMSSTTFLKRGGKVDEPKPDKSAAVGGDSGGICPPLEGAEDGQVCTRFPPEPSGYLHIGHAKACLLNQYYAERYKGKLLVRFDDTNPSKEKEEYEENILKDLATLKVVPNAVSHTSDYFAKMQDYAINMIKDGLAYMDDTDQEIMKEERMQKIESKHRNSSIEDNLRVFKALIAGDKEVRQYCMRAKIDMSSLNGTMRDPVMYRANEIPHHRTGTKFKAYPTYDFACPIVDSLEKVSHALRTTEYDDRDEQYKWIQKALKLKFITKIMTFGKMNFIYTVLSKRKLNWFVEQKLVEGWFDPRFPTIQGCIRRGIDIDNLKKFIISQGASRRVITMEWDKFWASNKDALEVSAPRYMGVSTPGEVVVTLDNIDPEITAHSVPLIPQIPDKGSRVCRRFNKIYVDQEDASMFEVGKDVTFLRWGNMNIKSIDKNPDGSIASVVASFDANATNFSKTKKCTWLAAIPDVVECTLVEFDHLITKPKLEENDKFQDFINPITRKETSAICDPCFRNVKAGTTVQLERKGFYRVDRAYGGPTMPAILFAIPDGKMVKK